MMIYQQFVRDVAILVLGQFRSCRFAIIRIARHQRFHSLLGFTHVRLVFHDQHYRPPQHVDCHDVQLVRRNRCKTKFTSKHFKNQTPIFLNSRGVIPNGNLPVPNFGSAISTMAPLFHRRSILCRHRNPCLARARKKPQRQQRWKKQNVNSIFKFESFNLWPIYRKRIGKRPKWDTWKWCDFWLDAMVNYKSKNL